VLRAHLDADCLARVRLAASPVAEATAWLGLTARRGRHPVFGDPGAAARSALADPCAALVAAILPPPGRPAYTPDLITPKPGTARDVAGLLGEQLDRIAATPRDEVAQQIEWSGVRLPPAARAAVERGTFAANAANGLRRFWAAALADGWAELRAIMEADLAGRASTMAGHGVGAMLGSLHPSVAWHAGTLSIDGTWSEEFTLSGVEIVCVPAVLAWPKLSVQFCDPRDAVLGYPAIGVGARAGGRVTRPVDRLLGPSRAALLGDLAVPRSTAGLSTRHRLAPGTVSYHLKVLQRAGLVRSRRDGKFVLYQRTESGCALSQQQVAGPVDN